MQNALDIPDEFDIPEIEETPTISPEQYAEIVESVAMHTAMELEEPEEIAARHGVTVAQLQLMLNVPRTKEMVKLHKQAWLGSDNTMQRIEKKAEMALELALYPVAQVALDPNTNDAVKIQAVKLLKDVSPLGDRARATPGLGSSINVSINLAGKPLELAFAPVSPTTTRVIEADG